MSETSSNWLDAQKIADEALKLARNAGLMLQQPGWREDLDELDVDVALVDPDTQLGYNLMDDPGWRLVEADDAYALLEPSAQS